MKLYAFKSGGDYAPKAIQDPLDMDPGGLIYEPWTCYVVDHPRGAVVFDTGIPPEILTDPTGVLGPAGALFDLRMSEAETTANLLATIDLDPAGIKTVVMSHLHLDHATALNLFTDAQVVVQRTELEFARNPPIYQSSFYIPEQFGGDRDWLVIDGEHDLYGDGSIIIFPTPGHTPGHQSVRVTLESQVVILLFDATYSLHKMRERMLPGVVWNPDAMVESWERIEQLERVHSATLLATHDPDVDRVRWAPAQWYE